MALLSCILRGHLRCIADYRGEFNIVKIIPHVPREEDDVFIKARSQAVIHPDEQRIAQFAEFTKSFSDTHSRTQMPGHDKLAHSAHQDTFIQCHRLAPAHAATFVMPGRTRTRTCKHTLTHTHCERLHRAKNRSLTAHLCGFGRIQHALP
jgi:hypothetical protein